MNLRQSLYGATIAAASFLLFSIEPMAAKQLLPAMGGSSAVWLTCLFFFQAMLLASYAYVFGSQRAPSLRRSSAVHLALLVAALASFGLAPPAITGLALAHPASAIFLSLLASIGLPFFLLGTTTPLLQAWFAQTEQRPIPYRLYALSNLASLAALIAYPLWFEPHLTLHAQRLAWHAAFVVYACLCALLTLQVRATQPSITLQPQPEQPEHLDPASTPPIPASRRILWFLLPAVGAMQLSAVTAHLTQNVAAIPLLWVIPLAVYLFSFVLAFEFSRLYRRWLLVRFLVVLLAALGYLLSKTGVGLPIQLAIAFFVAELFFACWFLHAELHSLRPTGARASTAFYLAIAAGGAAGTFFVAILSPLLFRANYDLPIAFAATAAAALAVTWPSGWQYRLLWTTATVLGCVLLLALRIEYGRDAFLRLRNFYGTLQVRETHTPPQAVTARTLINGSIQHGLQWFADDFRTTPMSYYAPDSGVGLALSFCCAASSSNTAAPRRIGVVGLGAGTVAAYGRPGDTIEFYEINPQVETVAHTAFTYLRDSPAHITITPGDARIALAHQPPQRFDILIVDAFSGDAIPVHLLTAEAVGLYRRHLAPGGVLAFHVSNQYLDLAPVLSRLAQSAGLESTEIETPAQPDRGEFQADWVLLSDRPAFFAVPEIMHAGIPVTPAAALWTDDYSSLLPLLRWNQLRPASH